MDNHNDGSGANTVFLVIILLVVVGFGVWWFTMQGATTAPQIQPSINLDVKLPTDTTGGSTTGSFDTTTGGSTTDITAPAQ